MKLPTIALAVFLCIASGLMLFSTTKPAEAQPTICGLLVRDGYAADGRARYRGIGVGRVVVNSSSGNRITSRSWVNVTPGHYVVLSVNQGFSCRM